MYAVIQTGGKQYRVQKGDVLRVAKLAEATGKKVTFDHVLLLGEGEAVKIGTDVARASVSAEVIEQGLGKKVEIFKKRRRKHSQHTMGHRQAFTAVRITAIGAAKATPAKAAAKTKAAVEKPVKAEVKTKTADEKPAKARAAATTTKAEPAAKKLAAKKADAKSEEKE